MDRYPHSIVAVHWALAVLVIALFVMGWYMVEIPKKTPPVAFWYNLHKSLGLVAVAPLVWLLWWRSNHVAPPLPRTLPDWQVKATHLSHWLFYVCLIVMIVSGFFESNFTKWGIKFFGIQLPIAGWEDKGISSTFKAVHLYASYLFAALIAIHVLAAVKHGLLDKDGVFERMLPRKT